MSLRKCVATFAPAPTDEQVARAKRKRRIIRLVLLATLVCPVLAILVLGPMPADPCASVWETVCYRVEHFYGYIETAAASVSRSVRHGWQRSVLNRSWDVESIVLVGGLVFLVGLVLMSRKVGR